MSFFNDLPSFTVSNDKVLDNLRVRQPHTLKVPPEMKIDPNSPGGTGDYNPATNPTLRSNVPQAGAIVYNTNPVATNNPPTGSFDGRNHLYFSAGKNWIPLANCPEIPVETAGTTGPTGPTGPTGCPKNGPLGAAGRRNTVLFFFCSGSGSDLLEEILDCKYSL